MAEEPKESAIRGCNMGMEEGRGATRYGAIGSHNVFKKVDKIMEWIDGTMLS